MTRPHAKVTMTQPPLAAALADLAAPLAASLGLELWGVELVFGGRGVVRVFVESENGVSVDQCGELSRLLGLSLDVEDIIPGAYVLEVSSPGLERAFFTESQLARAVGRRVEITLRQPRADWPGRRKFRGLLRTVPEAGAEDHDGLFLLCAEDVLRPGDEAPLVPFAFDELKKATLVHCFPEQTLPGKGAGKKKSRNKTASPTFEKGDDAAEAASDAQERGAAGKGRKAAAKASRNSSGDGIAEL